jgi:hypothetical protein
MTTHQLQASGDNANGNTVLLDHSGSNTLCGSSASSLQPFADAGFSSILIRPGNGTNDVTNLERTIASIPVTVQLGTGTTTVNLSPTAQNLDTLQGAVTVNSGGGTDTLNVNDQANHADQQTYTLTATSLARPGAATVTFNLNDVHRADSFVVNGGQGDRNTYMVVNTPNIFLTTLNSGRGSDNTVNVQATTGPLNVASADPVGVATTVKVAAGSPGSVQGMRGVLTVANASGAGGLIDLVVDDTGDATRHADVRISESVISGLAPAEIRYTQSNLKGLTVNGGSGGNTYTITNTPSNGSFPALTTTLNTGTGTDTVHVQRTGGSGFLRIDSQGGHNTVDLASPANGVQDLREAVLIANAAHLTALTVSDATESTNRTVTINPDGISGLAPAAIEFTASALSSLNVRGDNAGNTFTVNGTPPNVPTVLDSGDGPDSVTVRATQGPLTINGDGGADTVNVGNSGSIQEIHGTVDVTNARGATVLTLDDSADPIARGTDALPVVVSDTRLMRLAPADITYHNLSALTVSGGRGGNTFAVTSTARNTATIVNAGAGNNKIRVGSGDAPPAASTIDGLLGDLTVNGQNALSDLTINDQTHTTLQSYLVTATEVSRATDALPGRLLYSNLRTLTFNGDGSFDVPSTSASLTTILNAGPNATVRVGNPVVGNPPDGVQEVRGPLILGTLRGQDRIAVSVTDATDLQNRTATITRTGIAGLAPAAITYGDTTLSGLTVQGGGTGGNTFNVQSTAANTTLTIQTGPGQDVINVGSAAGTLDDIRGRVIVAGAGQVPYTLIDHSAGFNVHDDLRANNGASFPGGSAELTDGGNNEARSIFSTAPVDVRAFYTTFQFQSHPANGQADGMTFTLQGNNPAAVGQPGAGLGYAGILNSVAVLFDFYNGGSHLSRTNLVRDGNIIYDATHTNVNFASNHLIRVDLSYSVSTLTLTELIRDTVTGQQDLRTYTGLNIPMIVGGNRAYAGFTGATGSNNETSLQDIRTWVYTALGVTGPTTLNVNDPNGTLLHAAYTVTGVSVSRGDGPTVIYSGVQKLTLTGGTGANTVAVVSTVLASTTVVTAGAGVNSVLVGTGGTISGILGNLILNGQNSQSALTVDDPNGPARQFDVLADLITHRDNRGLPQLPINFSNFRVVTLNGHGRFSVLTTSAITVINASAASHVHVGNNGDGVQEIAGRILDIGGPGPIKLVVDDRADRQNRTGVMMTAADISGLAPADIRYDRAGVLSQLKVKAGGNGFAGGNTFTVTNTPPQALLTRLNTGFGDDTVNVQATQGPLKIGLHVTSQGIYTVNIGNRLNGLGDIQGPILIGAPTRPAPGGPRLRLTVDDTGNAVAGRAFTLDVQGGKGTIAAPGVAPITYKARLAETVTVSGGGRPGSFPVNTFTVLNTAANPNLPAGQQTKTTINSGNFGDMVSVQDTNAQGPLAIKGGAGDDTIKIGNTTSGSTEGVSGLGTVSVDGGGGKNKLIVADQNSTAVTTYTVSTTPNKVAVSTAPNFNLTYDKIQDLTLNGSDAAMNTFNGAIPNGTKLTINDTKGVVLGNLNGKENVTANPTTRGTDPVVEVDGIDGLFGGLTINSGGGQIDLVITDHNTDNLIYTVTANGVRRTGIGPITFDAIQSLNLTVGSGDNQVNVEGTPAPATVQGGAGADTFNVGDASGTLNGIGNLLTLMGVSGKDVLNINDQGNLAAQIYQLTGQKSTSTGAVTVGVSLNGQNTPVIQYTGMQGPTGLTLNGTSGGGTINVVSIVAGTPVTVHAGVAANTINVGNPANQLSDIQDRLTITDAGNSDTLNIHDQGTAAAVAYTLTVTNITASDFPAVLNYSSPQYLNLYGSSGPGDSFSIPSAGFAVNLTIQTDGPGGNQALVGSGDLDFVGGHLNITFAGANNTLSLIDQNGPAPGYTLGTAGDGTQGIFSRTMSGLLLTYTGIQSVTLNAPGCDSVDIQDTLPGLALAVQFGPANAGGNNTIDIQNTGESSQVTIRAGNNNVFNIEGTGANSQVMISAALANTVLIQSTGARSTVEVDTSGLSYFSVEATGGPVTFSTRGIGQSTLAGPAGSPTWEVTATDAGDLTGGDLGGLLHFSGIQTLYGGPDGDTFKFDDGATLSGAIIGQGRDTGNTLDFSAWGIDLDGIPFLPPDFSSGVIGLPPAPDQQLVVYYDIYNFSENIIFPSPIRPLDRRGGVSKTAIGLGLASRADATAVNNSGGPREDYGHGRRPDTVARPAWAGDSSGEHERPSSLGLAGFDDRSAHAHRDAFFRLAGDQLADVFLDLATSTDEVSGQG